MEICSRTLHSFFFFSPPSAFLFTTRSSGGDAGPPRSTPATSRMWARDGPTPAELCAINGSISLQGEWELQTTLQTLTNTRVESGVCVGGDADSRMKDETRTALRNCTEWRNGARESVWVIVVLLESDCLTIVIIKNNRKKKNFVVVAVFFCVHWQKIVDKWTFFRPPQTPLVCWKGQRYVFTALRSSNLLH